MENIICKKFFPYLNYQQENILSSLVHYGLLFWFVAFFTGATTRLFSTSHQRKDIQGEQRQQGDLLTVCSHSCKAK